eukprot:g6442.t1
MWARKALLVLGLCAPRASWAFFPRRFSSDEGGRRTLKTFLKTPIPGSTPPADAETRKTVVSHVDDEQGVWPVRVAWVASAAYIALVAAGGGLPGVLAALLVYGAGGAGLNIISCRGRKKRREDGEGTEDWVGEDGVKDSVPQAIMNRDSLVPPAQERRGVSASADDLVDVDLDVLLGDVRNLPKGGLVRWRWRGNPQIDRWWYGRPVFWANLNDVPAARNTVRALMRFAEAVGRVPGVALHIRFTSHRSYDEMTRHFSRRQFFGNWLRLKAVLKGVFSDLYATWTPTPWTAPAPPDGPPTHALVPWTGSTPPNEDEEEQEEYDEYEESEWEGHQQPQQQQQEEEDDDEDDDEDDQQWPWPPSMESQAPAVSRLGEAMQAVAGSAGARGSGDQNPSSALSGLEGGGFGFMADLMDQGKVERGEWLGQGGCAVVHRMRINGTELQRQVDEYTGGAGLVVKMVPPQDPGGVMEAAMLRELEVVERFPDMFHLNVVDVVSFSREKLCMIILAAMCTVQTMLSEHKRVLEDMSFAERMRMAAGAARGLQYLHSVLELTHGDVQPANILVTEQMVTKVTDFGLSGSSGAGLAGLTKKYAAPEAVATFGRPEMPQQATLQPSLDAYSFGVVMLQLLHVEVETRFSGEPRGPAAVYTRLELLNELHVTIVLRSLLDKTPSRRVALDTVAILLECQELWSPGNDSDAGNGPAGGGDNASALPPAVRSSQEFLDSQGASDGVDEFVRRKLPGTLEPSPFNVIYFVNVERYEKAARLTIVPASDVPIRVFMAFRGVKAFDRGLDTGKVEDLGAPAREGFVAVEWRGPNIDGNEQH